MATTDAELIAMASRHGVELAPPSPNSGVTAPHLAVETQAEPIGPGSHLSISAAVNPLSPSTYRIAPHNSVQSTEEWHRERWQELGGTILEEYLEEGAIALLSAQWLVAAAAAGARLMARQCMPSDAYLSIEELKAATPGPSRSVDWLPVVVVSCMHLTPSDPDPLGHTLRLLAKVLRTLMATGLAPAIGVFFSFSSIYQHEPAAGLTRTSTEEVAYAHALRGLPHLFSHPYTWVFKSSRFPDEYPAAYSLPINANVAAFDHRGWVRGHCLLG